MGATDLNVLIQIRAMGAGTTDMAGYSHICGTRVTG